MNSKKKKILIYKSSVNFIIYLIRMKTPKGDLNKMIFKFLFKLIFLKINYKLKITK